MVDNQPGAMEVAGSRRAERCSLINFFENQKDKNALLAALKTAEAVACRVSARRHSASR
jgi:hypothetical protein